MTKKNDETLFASENPIIQTYFSLLYFLTFANVSLSERMNVHGAITTTIR